MFSLCSFLSRTKKGTAEPSVKEERRAPSGAPPSISACFAQQDPVQCAVSVDESSSTAGSVVTEVSVGLAFSSSHSIGSGLRTGHASAPRPCARPERYRALLDALADLDEILGVLLRDQHRLHAAARAASSFSFKPPIAARGRAR